MVRIGVIDSLQVQLWGFQEGLWMGKLIMKLDVLWLMNQLSRPFQASHPLDTFVKKILLLIREDW
ncbi:hypothetical protein J1N35_032609 [Gossypium stocksii]|uniref:Uncharacterized protein n=1 Tax=Gossypium stocksii TaxID=47602 RepID=A0A9D3V3Z2_9ROSI|nr:hypothetical protein J1N35_032609 [Gossypium stocksii]